MQGTEEHGAASEGDEEHNNLNEGKERRGLKEDMANKGEKKDASFHLFSEGRHWQDLLKSKEQKLRNGCGNYSKLVKMQLVVHVVDSINLELLRFHK